MTDRIAIVGAREHPDLDVVRRYVASLPDGTVVISGGARGVDQAAEEAARERGLTVVSFRVFCGPSGDGPPSTIERRVNVSFIDQVANLPRGTSMRDALIFRNTFIALSCTRMVAFVAGSKGGTRDAIAQARRFRRPVEVVE